MRRQRLRKSGRAAVIVASIVVMGILSAVNATFAPAMPRGGSPIAGSPQASPVGELDCPGADSYMSDVATVLSSVGSPGEDGLFAGWRYAETSELSGHDFAVLSGTYQAGHDDWRAIEPPLWATEFHSAVDAYFGLVSNATLAASTRGVYAMGAYTIVIETARVSVISSLGEIASECPQTADALATVLDVDLPDQAATPEF